MGYQNFLRRVQALGGLESAAEAERATSATLASLGEILPRESVRLAQVELPEALAQLLHADRSPPSRRDDRPPLADLYARASPRLARPEPGYAVERVQAVLEALAEWLSDDALASLRAGLHPEIADRLEVRDRSPSAPPHPDQRPPGRRPAETLSGGHPGSHRPLSEGQFERPAQTNSVVRSVNPHGATKLSSAGAPGVARRPADEDEGRDEP